MTIVFHGTTRKNVERILNNKSKNGYTWWCSDDDYLYVWNTQSFITEEEAETIEEAKERAIESAFWSAQITAALAETPQNELVVLEFNIPENLLQKDDSCENMELASRIDNEEIDSFKNYLTNSYTHKHNSRMDCFVVANIIDNEYIGEIDYDLLEAAQIIKENNVYIESLNEFYEYEETNV